MQLPKINLPEEKILYLKEHWIIATGIASVTLILIFFILVLSGTRDCEYVTLEEGVYQVCDCHGLEITIKSTAAQKEKKTICIGFISHKIKYQQ